MPPPAPRPSADLFGQPRGLAYLAGTELWDRISFHGMQALLILYMVGQLLRPGHVENIAGFVAFRTAIEGVTGPLTVTALASQIFGLYVGLVYFMPVVGGVIGDRIGRRRTVALGAGLMTAGHLAMGFDATFLAALALLIAGAGCLRGNLVSQVGDLYRDGDPRRDAGFQLYFTGINLGAFIAPIVCGFLGQAYGWHVAFGFAAVGMGIGLAVFLAGARHLPPDRARTATAPPTAPLTVAERHRVLVLLTILPVLALFWVAQSQVWNVYNLWVRDHVDLVVLGWTMPVPWLQAIDGLAPVVLLVPTLGLWRWQRRHNREPDDIAKLAIGCLIFAAGCAWLALAPVTSTRAPLVWAITFHLLSNEGWLFFVPIALALWSRAAPASVNGVMVGVYYLSTFLGSVVSGRLGGLYETWSPEQFWLLHAGIVATAGVVFLVAGNRLRRALTPAHVDAAGGHLDLQRREAVVEPDLARQPRGA